MTNISKVSDITAADLAEYIRIPEVTPSDTTFLNTLLQVAIDYILNYTGIKDAATLDNYADMVIVAFVLCQDMYDTRTMYVNSNNVNKVVETILGMHQINLL